MNMTFAPTFFRSIALIIGMFISGGSLASAALKVGDAAPSLASAKWVRGEPVKQFEGDKVYIVEFWATWCGPCIQAIPHLNEYHQKFKERGLVVIGHNLDEDEATIKPFLSQMGGKMSYAVTCDDGSKRMPKLWLEAAGQNGIPCGFVIDKAGKIAYIGHPMSLDEALLTKLLNAPSTKPASAADKKPTVVAPPKPSAAAVALAEKITVALSTGKLDEAEEMVATLHEQIPDSLRYMGGMFDIKLLIARGDEENAIQLATMIAEDFSDQPAVVNQVAAELIAAKKPAAKLLETAEKIATKQTRAELPDASTAWNTLARVAELRGDDAKAADYKRKASQMPTPNASKKN